MKKKGTPDWMETRGRRKPDSENFKEQLQGSRGFCRVHVRRVSGRRQANIIWPPQKSKRETKIMDKGNNKEIPQEGTTGNSGESLLPTTTGSRSTGSGGSNLVQETAPGEVGHPPPQALTRKEKRARRSRERAVAWHERRKEREEQREREGNADRPPTVPPPTPSQPPTRAASSKTSWTSKFWRKGSTIFPQKKKIKKEEEAEPEEKAVAIFLDPAKIYGDLEDNCRMARVEEVANRRTVLRHLIRLRHPGGAKICFSVPELEDRLALRCASLPTDPDELRALTERVFSRRGEMLDMEGLYRDFVKAHGRIAMDPSLPYPSCYYATRLC
jgi:hypothetical protein